MPRRKAPPPSTLPKGLRLRGQIYWTSVTDASGHRAEESTGTGDFDAAFAKLNERQLAVWRVKHNGEREKVALATAIADWLELHSKPNKDTYKDDLYRVKTMLPFIGTVNIDEVKTPWLQTLHDRIVTERKCKAATANRYLELISAVLHWCHKRDTLDGVPAIPKGSEKRPKKKPLTIEQVRALLAELPLHLNRALRFALATGLRDANVRLMQWDRVDLARRHAFVEADDAKGEAAIPVPLNNEAVKVLQEVLGEHDEYCFTYEGEPIGYKMNNSAFIKAKKRAGVPWANVHTMRHTWATFHATNGTPMEVLQKLGAWKSRAMVETYAHLAPGFTAQFAENGMNLSSVPGTSGDKKATMAFQDDPEMTQVVDSMGWLKGLEPSTTGITSRKNVIELRPNQGLSTLEDVEVVPGKSPAVGQ